MNLDNAKSFLLLLKNRKNDAHINYTQKKHTLINERKKRMMEEEEKKILSSSHPPIEISDNLVVQSICKRKSRQFEQHSTIIVKNKPPKKTFL